MGDTLNIGGPIGGPDTQLPIAGPLQPGFASPHDGAEHRRQRYWRPTSSGPNSVVALSGPELVRRSRDLRRNNPHGAKALSLLETHIVGTGIKPRSLCPNEKVRTALMELWADWTLVADADQVLDFYGLQSLAISEMLEGGETFARMRTRQMSDGLPVPMQVQLLPTEQVPVAYDISNGTNPVIQGIERDLIGRRVAYWCYPQHPGDYYGTMQVFSMVPQPVPAADMCHLYNVARIGQLRGLPALAAAITTVKQLGTYLDAELVRKQTAAMLVGFVKKAINEDMTPQQVAEQFGRIEPNIRDLPGVALEPGTVQYLDEGEDMIFSEPPADSGFLPFVQTTVRSISAAVGVLYEELSNDWTGTNDRLFRSAMNTFKRKVQAWQWGLAVAQFNQPIWNRFVDYAVASGAVSVPKSVTPRELRSVEWLPMRHEYINPVQDVQATGLEMGLGLTSRSAAVAERGDDVEVIDAQIKADHDREAELGLAFSGLATAGKVNLAAVDKQETGADPSATGAPADSAGGEGSGASAGEDGSESDGVSSSSNSSSGASASAMPGGFGHVGYVRRELLDAGLASAFHR